MFFGAAAITLSSNSERLIDQLSSDFRRLDARCMLFEVHAYVDEAEATGAAMDLDQRRAASVVRAMRERGLGFTMIEHTHGKSQPLIPNPPGLSEPQNRRVHIRWRFAPDVSSRPDSRQEGIPGCRMVEVFLPDGTSCGFSL